ncbi:MAG: hypothetical protein AAB930_03015, partial [Patescibacteria group bacterium]
QDDTQLLLAMAANETWYFTLYMAHVGNSTADIKYGFTVPAGAAIRWACAGANVAPGGTLDICLSVTSSGSVDGTDGGNNERQVVLSGVAVTGGTAGNLQFQWAQNTATAVDTKVLTNSYLEAHK